MILLDTNVLIYGFDEKSSHHEWSRRIIRDALLGEGCAVNPVIVAELCVGDSSPGTVLTRLQAMGIVALDLRPEVAPLTASAFRKYLDNRVATTDPPKVPLPDFFIGAHALWAGLHLATADSQRYRAYFPDVELLLPEEPI